MPLKIGPNVQIQNWIFNLCRLSYHHDMIDRNLSSLLQQASTHYPIVTVTGPRQSGKTTVCRAVFPDHPYVSLEAGDLRDYASDDPRGFLAEYREGAIIDEVQRVPELLSYLQVDVDERPQPGRFILTGSQSFALSASISQSLAGRTAVRTLLPPSLDELARFGSPTTDELMSLLVTGAYPRIYDRELPAASWLLDYTTTYIQRDVRQLLNIGNLRTFTTFMRLVAGRTATELNLNSLASDAGITQPTAKAWLSVLETSYLCTVVPAWHRNVRKRLVKRPKLHMLDTGLTCSLLGIRTADQLRHHPLRGPIFESWVVSEILKARLHRGEPESTYHFRQPRGLEADIVVEDGMRVIVADAKSGATFRGSAFEPLVRIAALIGDAEPEVVVVHGGDDTQTWSAGQALAWRDVAAGPWVAPLRTQ